jgi:vitamin B12 transporter
VYAQQSIGIGPAGKVYAGLRAENDTPAGGTLEPAAGFLLPLGPLHIAGNAASSFIVPTLFDLYYPNFSNPNLLPERDRNVNIVISSDQTFLHPKLTIFDRTADNLITSTATTVINAGRAHFQGAVLSIAPRLFSQLTTEFSVTDLPTATQVSNDVAARVGYEPILQGTLSVEHPIAKGRFGYGVTARFAGAHTESFAPPGTFGQYSVFNAYARVRLSSKAVLTGRVNDIGNVYYGMFYAYPVPARSYRLELSTR